MSVQSVNPFNVANRAVGLYDALKKHVDERSDEILTSLPQFVRIALIEGNAGWYEAVNRFDLIVAVPVSTSFGKLGVLCPKLSVATGILPTRGGTQFVNERQFRQTRIVRIDGDDFTLQDFVLTVGYHGTFHLEPDRRPKLKRLYEFFVAPYPATSLRLLLDIGQSLVNAFEEVRKKFGGDNNAYSSINDRQPRVVAAGQVTRFGTGEPACEFVDSYLQIPIRGQKERGIRISLDFQLANPFPRGTVLSYGHRETFGTVLSLEYNPGVLLGKFNHASKQYVLPITLPNDVRTTRHKLELCVYPSGDFIVALNDWLRDKYCTPEPFEIQDGKMMVGSDLSGQRCGSFLNSVVSIEAIDEKGILSDIFRAGLYKLRSMAGFALPINLLERPALLR